MLSNLASLRIRARWTTTNALKTFTYLADIKMALSNMTSVLPPAQVKMATNVENCTCPAEYVGLSCETCASGFTRATAFGGAYDTCVPCECNNHSAVCHPESGVCIDCQHNTTGAAQSHPPIQSFFPPSIHSSIHPSNQPQVRPRAGDGHSPIHPPIHSSLPPSIHPSTHPTNHRYGRVQEMGLVPSTHPFILPSLHPSIHPSTHPTTGTAACRRWAQSHPPIHPLILPSLHPFIHPSIVNDATLYILGSTGDHCELCAEGLAGNATNGTPRDCIVCKDGYFGEPLVSCPFSYYDPLEILTCEPNGTIPMSPSPESMLEYQLHTVRNGHQLTPTLIRGEGGIVATHNVNDSLEVKQ